MSRLTLASWNMEWMNDWFAPDSGPPAFRPSFPDRDVQGHQNDTQATATRAAAVIADIDPDVLAVQEAPSRQAELELFVQQFLGGRYSVFLGDTGGAQKVGLLYKPEVASAQLTPHSELETLIDPWLADVDGDAVLDSYQFTRNPLVIDLTFAGQPLRLMVAHTKSNFINQGEQMWNDPATRQNYVVAALKNRRRISTEAMRMRTFLDGLLAADPQVALLACGDLNDGPGLDYFEENYLAHNCLDILIGSAFQPEWAFVHAQHDVAPDQRYTAIFDDFVTGEQNKHLLLDHQLLSPGLTQGALQRVAGSGQVRHAEYDAHLANQGQHREDRPSDHRPVSVQLEA